MALSPQSDSKCKPVLPAAPGRPGDRAAAAQHRPAFAWRPGRLYTSLSRRGTRRAERPDVLRESLRTSTDNADAGSRIPAMPAWRESIPDRLQTIRLELSMNANPKFLAATAEVDAAAVAPLPKSRRVYEVGSRPDIRVPVREISLADTPTAFGGEKNPPVIVYDTSGPYTDPDVRIDLRKGLPDVRSRLDRRARRHRNPPRPDLRVRPGAPGRRQPRRPALRPRAHAAPGQGGRQRLADALRAPRHHHAGNGIHRHPREACAASTTCRRCAIAVRTARKWSAPAAPAPGAQLRCQHPEGHHARVRARRSRPRPRDHPGQHQPPGTRADDHRPQLPGEDQRQHRQLGASAPASRRKWRS